MTWWAVAPAALAYYLLGALWFTPLFGKAWDRSIGHDRSPGTRFPMGYYLVPLAGALTAAIVIAALSLVFTSTDGIPGALIGAGVGLAIAAASLTNSLTPHTPHPYMLGAITGGYHLAGCVMAGLIIGSLR